MQQTTAPQSFQKSFTNEVWATFPPTQITLTVLCAQTFHFVQPSSSIVRDFFFFSGRIINFWAAVCQYISVEDGGGAVDTYMQTFLMCVTKLSYIKRQKHLPHSFFQPCTDSVRASTYPDTLRILWKNHMSPLRRHSNNLRTIVHSSLIMQMKQGSRPVACRQTVNTGEIQHRPAA